MRRALRIGRMVGFVLSGVIVAAWALSLCLKLEYSAARGRIALNPSYASLIILEGTETDRRSFVDHWWNGGGLSGSLWPSTGMTLAVEQSLKSPEFWRSPIQAGSKLTCTYLGAPLWMLLAAVLIPTVVMHRWMRQLPAGCCRTCGYDLTGNVSGRCPECGAGCERPPGAVMGEEARSRE